MKRPKRRPRLKGFPHPDPVHWKDADAMHEVLHSFPGWFRSMLLELLDGPKTHGERDAVFTMLRMRFGGGREMARHIQEVIPFFMNRAFSAKTVSAVTFALHVLLSVVKMGIGLLSRSAGLIADGIDNTVDTASSVLVWLGIRFERERLVSLLVIVLMFVSAACSCSGSPRISSSWGGEPPTSRSCARPWIPGTPS